MDDDYEEDEYLVPEERRLETLELVLNQALDLEKKGDLENAWKMLNDEWLGYTDHEYFDYEMASLFSNELEQLFNRNTSLLALKIEKICEECSIDAYHSGGGHDVALVEAGFKLTQEAKRPDLELMLLEHHIGIQVARFGPSYRDTEGLREKLAELRGSAKQFLEE